MHNCSSCIASAVVVETVREFQPEQVQARSFNVTTCTSTHRKHTHSDTPSTTPVCAQCTHFTGPRAFSHHPIKQTHNPISFSAVKAKPTLLKYIVKEKAQDAKDTAEA